MVRISIAIPMVYVPNTDTTQYIIMAMHAKPVPADPYNPMPPLAAQRPGETDTIRHPSPFVPIRLPIFAVVIWLNDWVGAAASGDWGSADSSTQGGAQAARGSVMRARGARGRGEYGAHGDEAAPNLHAGCAFSSERNKSGDYACKYWHTTQS